MATGEKRYLGDGVYAIMDGADLVLTTENGVEATNRIVLEPEVFAALEEFLARVRLAANQGGGS